MTFTLFPENITVSPHASTTFLSVTSIVTNLDSLSGFVPACPDSVQCSLAQYNLAVGLGPKNLFESHSRAWAEIWKSGIEVSNNRFASLRINSSLYYLLSSVRQDFNYPPTPGGLTSGYRGTAFWDTDFWMIPGLLTFPEIISATMNFRFERMQPAAEKAKEYHHRGLMYPWESGNSGYEVAASAFCRIFELHISGDIAYSVNLFWSLTKNHTWLEQIGLPMMEGIAEFWASRTSHDPLLDRYSIRHVLPPDEFAVGFPIPDGIDNSVFTNSIAKIAMTHAMEARAQLYLHKKNRREEKGSRPSHVHINADIGKKEKMISVGGKLIPELSLSPTAASQNWTDIVNKLVVLYDEKKNIHPEYENFPIGNTDFKFMVKQADTVLLGFPLGIEVSSAI